MSILSDITIRKLCTGPLYIVQAKGVATAERLIEEDIVSRIQLTVERLTFPSTTEALQKFLRDTTPDRKPHFRTGAGLEFSVYRDPEWEPMISPFINGSIRKLQHPQRAEFPIISAGLSSYGYDVTLSEDFKIFTNVNNTTIDPKRFDVDALVDGKIHRDDRTGEAWVVLPPCSYLLGRTPEWFEIPRDVSVVAVGKSTYARAAAIVNVTPIEAGFKGNVVIEVSNPTTLPMRIYANEGIAQFLFFKGDQPCETSYGDRKGKYQGQTGIRLPSV